MPRLIGKLLAAIVGMGISVLIGMLVYPHVELKETLILVVVLGRIFLVIENYILDELLVIRKSK